MTVPVFICVRDRVTHLRELINWLERAGHNRITLIDNDSAYEPLLDYLAETPHEVVRLGRNLGSRAIWLANLAPADEPFVYTDPDCLPVQDCPLNAVEHLQELLDRWRRFPKAGLGLHLNDTPPKLPVREWEESLVSVDRQIEPGVYDSLVDTTFALYRPGQEFTYFGIRTGFPYEVRHMSWYAENPGDEDRFYLDRAMAGKQFGSSWKDWVDY